uniref:Integrase catalytic domain-containing protein n=1 Tax=Fagus sylvatica TaxID=28930 RepID=A0A2N9GND3_FAGSY
MPEQRYTGLETTTFVSYLLAPLLSEIRSSRCQEADSLPKGPTATLGSAVPGLRSRHRRYRWKALEILDSTAQKTAAFDTGRALTRRLKIRCAATLLHAPPRARLLHCHVSPSATSASATRSNQKNYHLICAFCKHRGHTIDRCNMRAGILQRSAALTASESIPSSDAASFDPVSLTTPTYSIADLQAFFSQVQALSSSASNSALSVTPGISSEWILGRGRSLGPARKVGRLFELTSLHFPSSSVSAPVIAASASIELWHSRLGHVSLPRIQTLVSRGLLGSVSSSPFDCMPCQLGKQPALPFNNSESIASATFDLIHSDVWGPSPVPTTQYSKAIKVFRSDNAREYRQTDFSTILKHYGTIFHTSCAGTSQQNGRAERKLRHILDTVRALTNAASTPASFWGEAALTAVYTINRCPSPVIQNTTPYERLFGTAPNYSLLKAFGCVCFVLLQPHERTKLQPRSQLCCFLGYGLEEKGYRCYDPVAKRLRVSRHVVFWEHKMFYSLPLFSAGNSDSQADPLPNLFPEIPSPSAESVNPISDESPPADPSSDESPTADPTFDESPLSAPAANPVNTTAPEPRRSHRVSTLPSHLRDFHCFSAFATLHEPHTFREASVARLSSDPLWQQAMKEELDALLKSLVCQVLGIWLTCITLLQPVNLLLVASLFLLGYYLTVQDLISRAGITDSKIVDTPIEYNNRLNTHDGEPLPDTTLYRQLVGSLVYLTVTQPDISYAVHIVSQFMAAPRSLHYAVVLRILRYLKGTLFHGLHFSSQSSLTLQAYFDADWAGDPTDRRSTTGYCFLLGDSLISWRSKKQSVVARSSTEAEYRALADTTAELLWLRWLLQDLGIDCSTAVPIHCDNRSAIQIAHNDVFHERTKHIEIDCHFVRHHLLQGTLQLRSVSSQDQLADIFTKPMPPGRFRDLISKLKLVSVHPT